MLSWPAGAVVTVSQLALRLGANIKVASTATQLKTIASPREARNTDLTFRLIGDGSRLWDSASEAAAVLTSPPRQDNRDMVVADVSLALARAMHWLPVRRNALGLGVSGHHRIHETARISPHASVDERVQVGEATIIEAGAVIDGEVSIGSFCRIGATTVIRSGTQIGNRVSVGAGCSIGEDGFAYVREGVNWMRVPCFGGVRIGDDTALLAHVVIHAGVFSDTQIGSRCALDSQVLMGHDSHVGDDTAIAGQSALAGASTIGQSCRIGGKVGIGEGVRIADGVTVTAMSMVNRSIECENASYSSGWPAERSTRWWRRVSGFTKSGRVPADRLMGTPPKR